MGDGTVKKLYIITRLVQIACTLALYIVGAVLLSRADTLGYVVGLLDLLFAVFGTFALIQTIASEAGLSGPQSD